MGIFMGDTRCLDYGSNCGFYTTCVTLKTMGPFWVQIFLRQLMFRGTKMDPGNYPHARFQIGLDSGCELSSQKLDYALNLDRTP